MKLERNRIVSSHDHPHPDPRQVEDPLGKLDRHSDAAMRRGISGQRSAMERNPRPGNSLHEWHVPIIVEIGVVLDLFLNHAVNPRRGLISFSTAGNRRPHDPSNGIVDRNALVAERNNSHDRMACRARLNDLNPLRLRIFAGSCGLDDVAGKQRCHDGNGEAGAPH